MRILMAVTFIMAMVSIEVALTSSYASGKAPLCDISARIQDAEDKDGRFWNLKVGNVVTLQASISTPAGDIKGASGTTEVTDIKGKVCFFKTESGDDSSEMATGSHEGYFCWGEKTADKNIQPLMRMFKYGAKPGDTWDGWVAKAEDAPAVTVKYVGLEEVTVPAGTYKDVVHVQATITGGPTMDYYFAPKMGLIKFNILVQAGITKRLEMTAFKAGK